MRRLFLISAVVVFLLSGCLPQAIKQENGSRLKIATTIFPLYDIVQNVGGDKIEVQNILPAGASPHTFELTPGQVKDLQNTKLIFKIGHGLDDWILAISDSLPEVKIIEVNQGIDFIKGESAEEPVNPHYWLALENGKIIARQIADSLGQIDMANAAYYQTNAENYIKQLDVTEEKIKQQLTNLASRDIITFHDAWPYFAKEYNLNILKSFEPFPGKEPTPKYLEDLSKEVKAYNIKALFAEPQLSLDVLQSFIHDLGLKIYILDPLGGVNGRDSYIKLMQYNGDIIYQALK